jgi:L-2,4-diaminobutyrate decarboxylase
MHAAIAARRDFEALHEPESNILCFRYRGGEAGGEPGGRGVLDGGPAGGDERLDALNLRLREAYNRSGEGWITTTLLGGRRVLRVAIMNPRTTAADTERVLDGLAALARTLE